MKNFLFILFFIAYTTSLLASNNWWQATSPSYSSLKDIFFLNENIGWIAGADGTLLRTTDGGNIWETPTDQYPVTASMYSIFFVNENIGFAGSKDDILLKSIDGGLTWEGLTLNSIGGTIYSIYFSDEYTGWILSSSDSSGSEILHTIDGGLNWSVQLADTNMKLVAMDFYSSTNGVCVGGKDREFAIYYTTDRKTWFKSPRPSGLPASAPKAGLYSVSFASDTIVNIVGQGNIMQTAILLHSEDAGATWTYSEQESENELYLSLDGVDFKDELNGMAVGSDAYKGSVIYKTIDGGLNWKEAEFPFGFAPTSIKIINNNIWVVGNNGNAIVTSKNYGQTWELNTDIVLSNLEIIKSIGENTIVATGKTGAFIKSTDGGATWKSSYVSDKNVCPTVNDLFFLNENIGYAAQNNRTVSKTIDGGNTWQQIMTDTNSTRTINYGVQFIDENIGFVVGKSGTGISALYKTEDGGTTWNTQVGTFLDELKAICFLNENHGYVAGNDGAFAFTNDGGQNWNNIAPNNTPLPEPDYLDIEFYNGKFGLAGGDILVKTTDSGKTWNYLAIDSLPGRIGSIEMVDELTWYICNTNYILKTTDGGINWTNILDQNIIQNYISDLTIDANGNPWVAGNWSSIYSTSTDVGVKFVENNIPNNFLLEQNYPNPFNPSTIIRYSLPTAKLNNEVSLKVYNLLGQEVETLVNKTQNAGTYEVEFSTYNLPSGVYIYTLKSSSFSQSKKMILIK